MTTTHVSYIGGPTALIEYCGFRILIDPTFDEPRHYPEHDLTKTAGPGISVAELGPVDLVLLSHHGHADNFDEAGREVAMGSPLVLSVPAAAEELGAPVVGLEPWESYELGEVIVTALPGRHGPRVLEPRIGPVTGFLVIAPGHPSLYVSGDNSSIGLVREHAARVGPVDIAVLFAGAARVSPLPFPLTFTAEKAAHAAQLLGTQAVVGVHVEDWAHFSESRADLEKAFIDAGLDELLVATPRGERVAIEL